MTVEALRFRELLDEIRPAASLSKPAPDERALRAQRDVTVARQVHQRPAAWCGDEQDARPEVDSSRLSDQDAHAQQPFAAGFDVLVSNAGWQNRRQRSKREDNAP